MFEIYINVSVALSTFGSRSTIVNKDLVTIGMVERNSVLNKEGGTKVPVLGTNRKRRNGQ